MLRVLLLPVYLVLLLLGGAMLRDQIVAGWHSGAVPMALGCVAMVFALLFLPALGQKWQRRPGDPR